MKGTGRLAPGLLILTILAGPALGISATGNFEIEGALALPAGSSLDFTQTLVAHAGDTRGATLSIDAAVLHVRAFEMRAVRVPDLFSFQTSFNERSWMATNAAVRLTMGDPSGFAGYAPSGHESCRFLPA